MRSDLSRAKEASSFECVREFLQVVCSSANRTALKGGLNAEARLAHLDVVANVAAPQHGAQGPST